MRNTELSNQRNLLSYRPHHLPLLQVKNCFLLNKLFTYLNKLTESSISVFLYCQYLINLPCTLLIQLMHSFKRSFSVEWSYDTFFIIWLLSFQTHTIKLSALWFLCLGEASLKY